jgi:hypothetical protein
VGSKSHPPNHLTANPLFRSLKYKVGKGIGEAEALFNPVAAMALDNGQYTFTGNEQVGFASSSTAYAIHRANTCSGTSYVQPMILGPIENCVGDKLQQTAVSLPLS